MESQFPEIVTAQPSLMAQHSTEAGLNEKAVGYWLKAGQQAVARSAMAEAVAQLEKGLGSLTTVPVNPERQQQELDLRIALGPALIATKGYSSSEVGEAFAKASALAEQIDRPMFLFPLLYGRWTYHLIRVEPGWPFIRGTHRTARCRHKMTSHYCCWVTCITELFSFFLASSPPPMRCSSNAMDFANRPFGRLVQS